MKEIKAQVVNEAGGQLSVFIFLDAGDDGLYHTKIFFLHPNLNEEKSSFLACLVTIVSLVRMTFFGLGINTHTHKHTHETRILR